MHIVAIAVVGIGGALVVARVLRARAAKRTESFGAHHAPSHESLDQWANEGGAVLPHDAGFGRATPR